MRTVALIVRAGAVVVVAAVLVSLVVDGAPRPAVASSTETAAPSAPTEPTETVAKPVPRPTPSGLVTIVATGDIVMGSTPALPPDGGRGFFSGVQADLAGDVVLGNLEGIKGIGSAKRAHLAAAMEIGRRVLLERSRVASALTSPGSVRDYLRLSLASREHEVFVCIWLDAQHRVLEADELFRGTLTQTSVYPREVVKKALRVNAAAVIFAHNHPSGVAQPSQADELLTRNLKEALLLVEVRVLDHFIVAGSQAISFAERGLL